MSTVILNASLVLKNQIAENKNLLISDGKIADMDYKGDLCGKQVYDACGAYVFAGFIEVHVHGGGGADFMDADVKAFETAVKCHLAHGSTQIYPTAVAASHEDTVTFIENFKKFKSTSPYAKITPGVHLEGPYFFGAVQQSLGAQKRDALRLPDMNEVDTLLKCADGAIKRWDASPELQGACEFANVMQDRGILCAAAHTDATAEEAEKGFKNGFSHVTHFYNATSLHRKRGQKVYAGVVEATYLNDDVTIELIGDGCHIPKEDVYLALKIKGAEKVSVTTDAMRIAGTDLTSGKLGNKDKGLDVIVDDGVAKLSDKVSFAGSIATMDRCLRVLCQKYGIDLPTASIMLSYAPARLMGISDRKGSIEPGKDADLVIVGRDFEIKDVFVGGEKQ